MPMEYNPVTKRITSPLSSELDETLQEPNETCLQKDNDPPIEAKNIHDDLPRPEQSVHPLKCGDERLACFHVTNVVSRMIRKYPLQVHVI